MLRAALLLALVAGCQFDGGLGTGLLCPTGECPAGESCVDGRCTAGSGGSDAAISDGASGGQDASQETDAMTQLGPNLVTNPGMEDGIEPWTPYNATLDSIDVRHGGIQGLRVSTESSGDVTVYQDVIKTPLEIPQGQHYLASIWVRAVEGRTPPVSMKLTIRESGGAVEKADHDGPEVAGPGTDWVLLQASASIDQPDRDNVILIVWGLESAAPAGFAADDAVLRAD